MSRLEELYKQLAKAGADLQNHLSEAQKKNGVMEALFILIQQEINKPSEEVK